MSELTFNPDGNLVLNEREIPENCIIVVSKGKAKLQPLHEFGMLEIKTHQGAVKQICNTENVQF